MADAINDLAQMIERIRAEADAAGYARAMREVSAFVSGKGGAPSAPAYAPPPQPHVMGSHTVGDDGRRTPRGWNRRRVIAILKDADGPISLQQIKTEMEKRHGAPFAYSSTQAAMSQIEKAGMAKNLGSGLWLWIGQGNDDDFSDATE